MTDSERNELEMLRRENAQLKADKAAKLGCKVSEKGAISVYGLGRFPVTLYLSQWEAFIPFIKSGAVDRFIVENRSLLSRKEDKAA